MRPLFRFAALIGMFLMGAGPAMAAVAGSTGEAGGDATSGDVALLVFYVLVALIISFLCSIAEASLLSTTPSYIEGLRDANPKRADLLKRLRTDNIDRSLAAILTLNTIAHTAGAIGAGAQATVVFGSALTGAFSVLMTLAILFLSEIVPKTLGTVHWRTLAEPSAHFTRALIVVLYPLVIVSEWLTKLISRGKSAHAFSRQEFIAMAEVCEVDGQIDMNESRILRNLFKFSSLRAADVMTPRTVVTALPGDMTVAEAKSTATQIAFSRLPIYGESIDDIRGFILKDELFMLEPSDGTRTLKSLSRDISAVPARMPLSTLLEFLLEHREHIALVVDEYGGTSGLVTLEDAVETLLGVEIVDETDSHDDMQAMARRPAEERG
ncbi:MAG: hemolysin family protein [Coriobacteriia bacterium]|nr:hemolysin family protein [Coriobacteriia bacterium]